MDPDDLERGTSGEGSHRAPSSSSSTPPPQAALCEWSSTGDTRPSPDGDPSPSSSSGDHADAAGSDTDTDDARGGVVPRSGSSTVYVDLSAELYHAREEHTGPDPAAFTRDQAERLSFRACPDCFDSED